MKLLWKVVVLTGAVLCVSCDARIHRAKEIVRNQLPKATHVDFRRLRSKDALVCGEVDADDMPGSGWRYFVAYTELGKAVIAPPGGVTAQAEVGSPALAGEADRFNGACS